MFIKKEEGKESPVIINQEKTAVLETEGGIRILLRTEAADKISASLEIRQEEEAAVFLHAFKQPEEPFFGAADTSGSCKRCFLPDGAGRDRKADGCLSA